jgi:hypothetical protein
VLVCSDSGRKIRITKKSGVTSCIVNNGHFQAEPRRPARQCQARQAGAKGAKGVFGFFS